MSTLVACEENTDSYGYCLDWEGDDIITDLTQFSECLSQKWVIDECLAYDPDTGDYTELVESVNVEVSCENTNLFEWVYTCDYLNKDGELGYAPNKLTLKLIKTLGQQSYSSQTWDLMLKNVYSLGTSNISVDDPPIVEIVHVGGQLGTETASSTGRTYLNIFGLDNLDSAGDLVEGGDGKIDIASGQSGGVINSYGDILIPFHMPFAYDEGEALENININGASEGIYWGNTNSALENIFDDNLSGQITENLPCINTIETPNGCLDIPGYYEYTNGPDMYFASNDNPQKEFKITVKNINQNTTINLDFMIVEGSETLTDGNEVLLSGIDYRVDYNSGTLTLISDRAKNSSETLTVSYDRHEIVSFDQKLILGNYFKYDFSENSNIFGGAYMYTQDISQKKVDIGYEPMKNFMWHIGGNYSHEFERLNERINANTSINLNKASKFELLTEYAEINPNPNPLGVAYIDNFEGASEGYPISEGFSLWKPSSPPLHIDVDQDTTYLTSLTDRNKLMWYNPLGDDDIATDDIWDVTVESTSKESTLWLEIPEAKNCELDQEYYCYTDDEEWWSGITTYISDHDHKDKKYLDLWLNISGAGSSYHDFNKGLHAENSMKLHLDFGEISEDINLSGGFPNQEDSPMGEENSEGFGGNLVYEESEDVGIDSCKDEDENGWGGCLCKTYDHYGTLNDFHTDTSNPYYRCEQYKTLEDGRSLHSFENMLLLINEGNSYDESVINVSADPLDPNRDNWNSSDSDDDNDGYLDWSNYNGTENNSDQSNYKINNTEDFNANGILDLVNSYFTYEIDLSRAHEETNSNIPNPNSDIFEGNGQPGWALYRIPLNSFEPIKENEDSILDWSNIQHFRIRISGDSYSNNFGQIGIASIELVGNQWKNLGVISNDYSLNAIDNEDDYIADDNILIEVINTHQKNPNYIPPPDFVVNTTQSIIDGDEYEEMEQSLVVKFECGGDCYEITMQNQGDCENNLGCIWNDSNNSCVSDEECGIKANSSAFIKKVFPYSGYDAERQNSFFAYKNMEMYYKAINEDDYLFTAEKWQGDGCTTEEEDVEMVFRFGKDDNYYEITQTLDNNCDDQKENCDPAWNNLNINLEELTYFKKYRNTPYQGTLDVGIDGCLNSYETGYFNEHNNMLIPKCFEDEWINNGETFNNLCSAYLTTNNCDEDNNNQECQDIIDKINVNLCSLDSDEEYYKIYDGSKKHYKSNKNDPSGDDFQIPNEDCCIFGDTSCSIDNKICSVFREGIDCVESIDIEDNINCTDLPICPDLSAVHSSLLSEINLFQTNIQGSFEYLGSEDNYNYDCYFYDSVEWDECPAPSTFDVDNPPITYNDNPDDFYIIGEINDKIPYIVPAASNQEHDIWIWDSKDAPEIENVCNECTSVSIKGDPAINRIEYVIVGVKNDMSTDIYGSMWINELRMSGVKKEKG